MKTIQLEIPDGKRAEWVNGVLTLVDDMPQDITERIKTFEDAVKWCEENGEANLVNHYDDWEIYNDTSKDIIAYLKLRIITCALNEGWEPDYEQPGEMWCVVYRWNINQYCADWYRNQQPVSLKLTLKSKELANYAASQFADIYAGLFGIKKGGKE